MEGGLVDVDCCYYFKMVDELYLFVWCEKVVLMFGVVLIDFV